MTPDNHQNFSDGTKNLDQLPEWVFTNDGHRFQLPQKTAKIIAQRGYSEVSRASVKAIRLFNQGQFGDTVGSTYQYTNLNVITTNRNGSTEQDSSSAVVKKEIEVPLIVLMNENGKLIKLLVASQVVLDDKNKPIEDFFKPEDLLNSEELSIYNQHHGKGGRIDIKTRMILTQAEQTLAKFHKILTV